jgi:hypothetical protein
VPPVIGVLPAEQALLRIALPVYDESTERKDISSSSFSELPHAYVGYMLPLLKYHAIGISNFILPEYKTHEVIAGKSQINTI